MRQRTCSYKILELYNEIILKDSFKKEFFFNKSYYKDDIYVTIFKNGTYKVKLLLTDKSKQNIIFENINGQSFIIDNEIESSPYLYSIDVNTSTITKFNNPILQNGTINSFQTSVHPFISLSKVIDNILIKDEIIYFFIIIAGIIVENDIDIKLTYKKNYLTSTDLISNKIKYANFPTLIGINTDDLLEKDRDYFGYDFDPPLLLFNQKVNRKNSILITAYNDYLMENITYLVDYSSAIRKQLHPEYLIKVNNNYIVILPLQDYNTYSDFKLIRLDDLKEIDLFDFLYEKNDKKINKRIEKYLMGNFDKIKLLDDNILIIDDFKFSCDKIFQMNFLKKKKTKQINNPRLIPIKCYKGNGYALDIHTIRSKLLSNGNFQTIRTNIGELLYQLKYKFDINVIEEIAKQCSNAILSSFDNIDVLIPVPPSNLNRTIQPVYELAKKISELTKIPVDLNYIEKLPTKQIKSLNDNSLRISELNKSITVKDERYKNKNILIFDDLYRSGDTLSIISKKLLEQGKVKSINIFCVTKTRTA